MALIFLSIFWVILIRIDSPLLIDSTLLEHLLVNTNSTAILITDICLGFIISSGFYLAIVFFPDERKKEKVSIEIEKALKFIISDGILLFVKLYKNCCFESEWDQIKVNTDNDFFTTEFYSKLARLNVYNEADTCQSKKPGEQMKNYEYLHEKFINYHNIIEEIFTKYIIYMNNDVIIICSKFKDNLLFSAYLNLVNESAITTIEVNNIKYCETLSQYDAYKIHKYSGKIFKGDDGERLLKSMIDTLLDIREFVAINYGLSNENYGRKFLMEEGAGRTRIGIDEDIIEENNE